MAEQIGVSSRSIENNIKKLKEYGILEKIWITEEWILGNKDIDKKKQMKKGNL